MVSYACSKRKENKMKLWKWWQNDDVYTQSLEANEKIKTLNLIHNCFDLIDKMLNHIQKLQDRVECLEKRVK